MGKNLFSLLHLILFLTLQLVCSLVKIKYIFKKMKKNLFFGILSLLLLASCDNSKSYGLNIDNYKNYPLDGMWQLKTVKDANGNEDQVDTVYYSFHREAIFSFTITENSKSSLYPFYGYMDMPSNNKVHVLMNGISTEPDLIELFLSLSGWSSADIIFDIEKYNQSNLVLFDSGTGKTYTLKKF